MRRHHNVDVTLTHGNDWTLHVTGTMSLYVPATGPSMSHAGGDPAEGGEIEDVAIFLVHRRKDGKKMERELEDVSGVLWAQIEDDVYQQAAEDFASDRAAAAEARYDAMRDR